jgi:hypothetical protein
VRRAKSKVTVRFRNTIPFCKLLPSTHYVKILNPRQMVSGSLVRICTGYAPKLIDPPTSPTTRTLFARLVISSMTRPKPEPATHSDVRHRRKLVVFKIVYPPTPIRSQSVKERSLKYLNVVPICTREIRP